jgi:hypothetical protein
MNESTYPHLNVSIGLTDTTTHDGRVRLNVDRFQRCTLSIGGAGYGGAYVTGTPEQFRNLAQVIKACATEAEQAEAGRALDDATHAVHALTRAGVRDGGAQ